MTLHKLLNLSEPWNDYYTVVVRIRFNISGSISEDSRAGNDKGEMTNVWEKKRRSQSGKCTKARFILQLELSIQVSTSIKPLRVPSGLSHSPSALRCPHLPHWLLTWLLWMDIAQASWRGSCCRLRNWPPVACTVQRSARMTSVTPQRNRTWGSPEEEAQTFSPASGLRSAEQTMPLHPSLLFLTFTQDPAANPSRPHPHHLPLPSVSNPTTTPRAPFTRPRETAKFFTSITYKGKRTGGIESCPIPTPGLRSHRHCSGSERLGAIMEEH